MNSFRRYLILLSVLLATAFIACGTEDEPVGADVVNNDFNNSANNDQANNDQANNDIVNNGVNNGSNNGANNGANNGTNNGANNGTNSGSNNGGNNGTNNGANNGTNNGTNNGQVSCARDSDCGRGEVCELGGAACDTPVCAQGCHVAEDCGENQVCARVECLTCPCPGACEDLPDEVACRADTDCDAGEVCELGGDSCNTPVCTPGCRNDEACGRGQRCEAVECLTCPCADQCQTIDIRPDCIRDADCGEGEVCEFGGALCLQPVCVPGCRADADCAEGTLCTELECLTCPCPSQCLPPDTNTGCRDDTQCPDGEVCEPGSGCVGANACVPGCHSNDDCAQDEICNTDVFCFTCPCPGSCEPTTGAGDCRLDADCPDGQVCEGAGDACATPTCVPGCRTADDCGPRQRCNQQFCLTCPCPSVCEDTNTPDCRFDRDCANGEVCVPGGANCDTPVCVPGCRNQRDCDRNQRCETVECLTCPCPDVCQ